MRLAAVLAAAAVAVGALALSIRDGLPQTWRALDAEYERFEPWPRERREGAFVELVPLPVDLFGWYRAQLRHGDRYYVHGAPGGFSRRPFRWVVRNAGRLYFAGAVEVDRVEDADVIITWGADPAELGLRFCHQVRAGQQPYFVSRVRC